MNTIFLKILNMSITASWLILAVVLARLLLKKAPKWVICLLWALVAIRLVCPVSFESALSLVPSAETVPADFETSVEPRIKTGVDAINFVVNPAIYEYYSSHLEENRETGNVSDPANTHTNASNPQNPAGNAEAAAPVSPMKNIVFTFTVIWLAGVAAMIVYAEVSYLRLRHRVRASYIAENGAYICDDIGSPFILGVFRPRIYIPSSLKGRNLESVLAHENAHISRRDHLWKPLGFLILAVYWFNPLCWLAYILLCRDIEMACDEKVIRNMSKEEVARYSQTLLDCSLPGKRYGTIAACPLAFGEVGVKQRVKGILNYKKPAFWVLMAAFAICIGLAVLLMTNPKKRTGIDEPQATPSREVTPSPELYPSGTEPSATAWIREIFKPSGTELKITLDEYPGEVFELSNDMRTFSVSTDTETKTIYKWSFTSFSDVWLCDVTGDGKRDFCANLHAGSGIVDKRILVYDHAAGKVYQLQARFYADYYLKVDDGKMTVYKAFADRFPEEIISHGKIAVVDDVLMYVSDSFNQQELFSLVEDVYEEPDYNWVGKDISDTLFDEIAGYYMYAGGAGGWSTKMKVVSNGCFTGTYSGKGFLGEGETLRDVGAVCRFSGMFGEVKKVNDYVYSAKITKLEYDEPGREIVENNISYVTAEPRGLQYCTEIMIYLKGCEKKDIPENAIDAFKGAIEPKRLFYEDRLTVFGIYNVTDGAPDPQYEIQGFALYQ